MKRVLITLLVSLFTFVQIAEAKTVHHSKKVIKHHHKFDGITIAPVKIKKR
jgi:hypothetical protein